MADRVGERFGDYQLLRFLGDGSFGDVYLGEHVDKKTPAAVKVFKTTLTPDKLKGFLTEVRTVLLRHPNIVPILDFGIGEGDIPFLVMEYAPNGTLGQHHPKGTPLPLSRIVSYVKQLAAALQYAHDERRIHRDVKPENMLFGANNQLLLSDFGIAVVAHNPPSQRTEDAIGTARYMAPEQWRGKPVAASDQYAVGIIVYEWLCGESPFAGGPLQLLNQHIHVPPPPFKKDSKIPPQVEQVVMIALAKDPQQRFASVQAFATALEQASVGRDSLVSSSGGDVGPGTLSPDSVPLRSPVVEAPLTPVSPLRPVSSIDSSGAMFGYDLAHTHSNPDERILSPTDKYTDILPPPPSNSIEQLVQEGVRAQVGGRIEEAFRIWRQVMATSGIAEEYRTNARNRIRELCPQMLPSRLKQAREASMQGRWQDEIRLWEDLLALEPSAQDLASLPRLSLISGNNSLQSIEERLQVAQQNRHSAGMYAGAQQYIHNSDSAAAYRQLRMLWDDAPYYGDPAGLAQIVGLPAPLNYEQALADEQARQKQLRQEQKQLRQERERKKQAIAKHKRNKRILVAGGIGGGALGAGIGAGIGVGIGGATGGGVGMIVGAIVGAIVGGALGEGEGIAIAIVGGALGGALLGVLGGVLLLGVLGGAIVGTISLAVIRILAGREALAFSGGKEVGVVTIAGVVAGIIGVAAVAVAGTSALIFLAGLAVTVVVGVVAGALVARKVRKKS